ncbi:MAG: hypothetical protein R3308_11200, partial [Thiohalobacterales bacterium]|nr:hypothetical protein [Thiohalobacterales bacterium]
DAISRTDIMTLALQRLGMGRSPADRVITYIGDGPWDYRASMELGWAFIGIAEGARASVLRELGADRVLLDARETALRFYYKHGYRTIGPGHVLYNSIAHVKMAKTL